MATASVVNLEMATATPVTEERVELVQVGNGFPPLTERKQPGELGDEQLAQVVSNGLVSLAVVSEGLKPYFFELRERFHKKAPAAEIHGCRTWDEYCTKILKRTRRAVNYLLSGGNPASKRNTQGAGTGQPDNAETPTTENGKPPFAITQSPIDGDVAWSKEDASRRMLSWNACCLKPFSPTEKREIAEDLIAKLRDEMEFEAPQPPPIKGDAVPEPDPGTLDELRQRVARMADLHDIKGVLDEYTTQLLAPLLANHPYAPKHAVSVNVRRNDNWSYVYGSRILVGDWLECVEQYNGTRLKKFIKEPVTLGRVVGFDARQRPKVRWHDGQSWTKPYSLFDEVRVLFDWQAAEKYPDAFKTCPRDPEPPSAPTAGSLTTAITSEQQVASSDDLLPPEIEPAPGTGVDTEANSPTPSFKEQEEAEQASKAIVECNEEQGKDGESQ